ncbi:helix-turn-helix domain-containing protein [Terasakiella sp. SH-1]|uniref:helix-turn-helix domain-containing protein n=1 Tax=Terasakiella sp. SH-1 TaxID=2560057 RepID=UPI001074831B|nr:helix-turn-helix domain-containing protein [Terasakiella sp. SH-1]
MTPADERVVKHKIKVLNYAVEIGNASKACRYFGISRDTFHRRKREYAKHGEKGLINSNE